MNYPDHDVIHKFWIKIITRMVITENLKYSWSTLNMTFFTKMTSQNYELGWVIPFYKNYQLAYMDRALVSFEQYLYKWWEANSKTLMDHIHVISSHPRHRRHQCNLNYGLRNYYVKRGDVIPFRLELRMKHASSPNLSILVDVACWRYFTARRTGILAWPAEAELSWLLIGQFWRPNAIT